FHGRDLFAPAAVRLALGQPLKMHKIDDPVGREWHTDLHQIIEIDHFGNLITGLNGKDVVNSSTILVANRTIHYGRTFSEVAPDQLFWYRNSIGLIEIAANGSSAADLLDVSYGERIELERTTKTTEG
ncbi:MAG: SAM-dependent chlorinase/fluorinase, partial [Mariprofundales bacterium]|nr:SAM-dependent chlorinase/fluorinase [Mariprofundales bacterium]